MNSSAASVTSGSLTGSGPVLNFKATPVTLVIGGLRTDSTFAGTFVESPEAVSIEKAGTGTLALTGENSYSGGTTVSEGTLRLGSNAAAGTGTITTTGSAISHANCVVIANAININTRQLQVLKGETATQAGVIFETAGPRPLEKIGGGTLMLTCANTYNGVTTITAGTLQIGDGGATGTIGSGNIVNNAVLNVNRSNIVTSGQIISGSGAVIQGGGAGFLILSSVNTYSGGTILNNGTVSFAAATVVGPPR